MRNLLFWLLFIPSLAFADLNVCPRMPTATAVTNQWINSISASGATTLAQPAFSNLSGNIATSQMNSGTSASSSTFWRGDGTWATPSATGTVTSVTLTGDGTVLSATPSSAVTTSGTLTAALLTQTANTFLGGPTSGGAAAPTFRAVGLGDIGSAFNYFSGYLPLAATWSTTSGTFGDGTNANGNTLTTRASSGMTVTAGASSVAGITWTPTSSTAGYLVSITTSILNTVVNDNTIIRLTDGTNVIASVASQSPTSSGTASACLPATLVGIYLPGTASAITLKVQVAIAGGGTGSIRDCSGLSPSVDFKVFQFLK